MKTLHFLFCYLIVSVIIYGCSTKKNKETLQVIKVDLTENPNALLSDFVDGSEMIALETSDSCLLSSIFEVEVTKDYLFVTDYKHLYQFDRKGKFIRSIGSVGRGPYEYTSITCFTITEDFERVYIGTLRKILCFDFSGKPIQEIKVDFLPDNLSVFRNKLMAFWTKHDRLENGTFENKYLINQYAIPELFIEDTLQIQRIPLETEVGVLAPNMQYLSKVSDALFVYCPILLKEPIIRDTLYQLNKQQLTPVLKVDFSDYARATDDSKNLYISNINRSERYLLTEFRYHKTQGGQHPNRLFIYDYKSGIQYNPIEGFTDDIFGTGHAILRPLGINFDQMYFAKEAMDLEGIVEGVNAYSNPVLFFVSLKK